MKLRFTIKNGSRYGRMLEELRPWQLLDALRWGFSRRQVSCGDMVNADTCRNMDDTFRLAKYDKCRARHVPTVEVRGVQLEDASDGYDGDAYYVSLTYRVMTN